MLGSDMTLTNSGRPVRMVAAVTIFGKEFVLDGHGRQYLVDCNPERRSFFNECNKVML